MNPARKRAWASRRGKPSVSVDIGMYSNVVKKV